MKGKLINKDTDKDALEGVKFDDSKDLGNYWMSGEGTART